VLRGMCVVGYWVDCTSSWRAMVEISCFAMSQVQGCPRVWMAIGFFGARSWWLGGGESGAVSKHPAWSA
jgi:hypothetical protein